MMSKKGLFPFKDLVTLIMKSGVDNHLSYNKLVKKLPIPYMELALSFLVRGKSFDRPFEGAKALLAY